MAKLIVRLPGLLAQAVGAKRVDVEGRTLAEALEALRAHPRLGPQLFEESGALRPHVLCFLNDVNTRWLDDLSAPLEDGDELNILQAVSGG